MKKFYTTATLLVVFSLAFLVAGCFLQPPWMNNNIGTTVGLPPDTVNDVQRSYAGEFQFETLLPVSLALDIDLYQSTPIDKESSSPETSPSEQGVVIVTLHDSAGNLVYTGKADQEGLLSTVLMLPSAPEDMTLTLQAQGYTTRRVTIHDLVKYSEINRTMGLLADGGSAKFTVADDRDEDGIPDVYDAFPDNPNKAFSNRIPAEEGLTVAYEDLYGRAAAGDADYNDFIAQYHIYEDTDGEGKIESIHGVVTEKEKIAGYNHLFGIYIDYFEGNATLTVDFFDMSGGPQSKTVGVTGEANIVLFMSSEKSKGKTAEFWLEFPKDNHQAPSDIDHPPYNPYILVWDTMEDIHLAGEEALPGSDNEGDPFKDSVGFPWGLLVPSDWRHPDETQRIEVHYPRFTNWRESYGEFHSDWYLHYDDPYVPEPTARLVEDINSSGDSSPANLMVYNGAMYFSANDGASGNELWKYDGVNSPSLVKDINSGSSNPSYLKLFDGNLYFSAKQTGADYNSLYKHDGSNTNPVTSLSNPLHLAVYGGFLYFGAFDVIDTGQELWYYNGSAAPAMIEINSYKGGSSFPGFYAEYDSDLYFQANDGTGGGSQLWKFDGSIPTKIANTGGTTNPQYLTLFGGKLYFVATNATYGQELFAYDSVADSTTVIDVTAGSGSGVPSTNMIVYNGALYFAATDGSGIQLWKYDVSTKSVAAAGLTLPTTSYFAVYDNELYFNANDGTTGYELWKYDGSTATQAVDINGSGSSNPSHLRVFNNKLYFQADDGITGKELWELSK